MLEWNVFVSSWGKGIEVYNVFDHDRFYSELVQLRKKFGKRNATQLERAIFEERVKRALFYWFGSKCEWEVVVTDWPPHIDDKERFEKESLKVDVYKQIMMNWQHFIIYVWAYRDQLKEKR